MPVAQRYASLNRAAARADRSPRSAQQADLQKALADANSLIITAQTRPERAQAEISSSQTRIQQINAILKSGKDAGKTISADQRNQLNAELASINALIDAAPSGTGRQQPVAGSGQQPA
jgi:potassium efflux system protein